MNLKPLRIPESGIIKERFHLPPITTLKVKLLSDLATVPSRAELGAAGYDLFSIEDFILRPSEYHLFKTDVCMEIPEGYYGRIAGRSGLAYKFGIDVLGGVIDSSYRGNIGVILVNHSKKELGVEKGKAIAQLILERIAIFPIELVTELSETCRGEGGFGSTNR